MNNGLCTLPTQFHTRPYIPVVVHRVSLLPHQAVILASAMTCPRRSKSLRQQSNAKQRR